MRRAHFCLIRWECQLLIKLNHKMGHQIIVEVYHLDSNWMQCEEWRCSWHISYDINIKFYTHRSMRPCHRYCLPKNALMGKAMSSIQPISFYECKCSKRSLYTKINIVRILHVCIYMCDQVFHFSIMCSVTLLKRLKYHVNDMIFSTFASHISDH